ncbi:MAG: hypothetical protein OXG15_06205 [Gammaproteobacteria bacterium]|nr:hypothetical protein [Gammaproteobacteria bacterium]
MKPRDNHSQYRVLNVPVRRHDNPPLYPPEGMRVMMVDEKYWLLEKQWFDLEGGDGRQIMFNPQFIDVEE